MKIFLLAIILSSIVNAEVPQCYKNHWASTQFILLTGGENCLGRTATCNFQGSKSEGWYSYPEKEGKRLSWGCSEEDKPECANQGTKGEGWEVDSRLYWSRCSQEDVVCVYPDTKNEGWFAYPAASRSLIIWYTCSEEI